METGMHSMESKKIVCTEQLKDKGAIGESRTIASLFRKLKTRAMSILQR
jgi:hypothetical protein